MKRLIPAGRQGLAWFVLGVVLVLVILSARALIFPPRQPIHGELVILSGADDSTGGQRQQLVDEWNRTHPDNPARLKSLSSMADAQHSEMVASAQSGDSGVDVYNLDVTWVIEFAAANYIRPLDDSVDTNGFLEAPLESCRIDGRLWALPFNTDAGLLYYRTDVVSATKAALPQRLPPSENDTRTMVNVKPDLKAAYVGQLSRYEGLTVNALEAIWAAGGDVLDDGKVVIDHGPALAGLRQLALGLAPSGSLPPVILPDARTYAEDGSRRAFQRGDVALMRNWPVAYGQLKNSPLTAAGFGVAALPGPSVLGGQNLAIASDTKNPKAAQELIEFLTSDSSQRKLFRDGGLAATRYDAYDDPNVKEAQPYAQILRAAVENARPRPRTPHYALFSGVLQDVVSYALAHDGNLPERAVARLTDALQGRLN